VQDNGVGFEPSQTDGLGLAGMRERVESLNGDFSLQTQINKGSIIMAWLPLKQSHLTNQ
jgi:signal transduction histidine kinase